MTDRRAALEAAFDADEEAQKDDAPEPKDPDTPGLGSNEPITDLEPKLTDKPKEGGDGDKPLLETGEKKAAEKPDVVPPQKVEKQPVDTGIKAPVTWRPENRSKWGTIPKEIQEEVVRRDREVEQTLRQTADQRNYAQQINQVIAPYEAMIRAEGGNHVSAVDALLKTAYHLRTAHPQAKAAMVAQMIQQHGVDLELLDAALEQVVQGKQAQLQQDPTVQYIQQQLQPMQQFIQSLQNRQTQLTNEQGQTAINEMQAFADDPKNEYFQDVRGIMADFVEASAKMGQKMSLQDAYDRATLAHPEISKLVIEKRISVQAAQRSAAARKAKNASASLSSSGGAPAGVADNLVKPTSRRSAIEAAWDEAETRSS